MHSPQEYFQTAYRTGSDVWTHVPYWKTALQMLPPLPRDSMILDVGSGRGLWALKLVDMGYRVLGIDYVKSVVDWANEELKNKKISDRARFVHGDINTIPFTDKSFDAVTDIGLLHHLSEDQFHTYSQEVRRVLKDKGYLLVVTFSKDTPQYLGLYPKTSDTGHFEKFGIPYHFFTSDELKKLFSDDCTFITERIEFFESKTDPADSVGLIFSLFQKK